MTCPHRKLISPLGPAPPAFITALRAVRGHRGTARPGFGLSPGLPPHLTNTGHYYLANTGHYDQIQPEGQPGFGLSANGAGRRDSARLYSAKNPSHLTPLPSSISALLPFSPFCSSLFLSPLWPPPSPFPSRPSPHLVSRPLSAFAFLQPEHIDNLPLPRPPPPQAEHVDALQRRLSSVQAEYQARLDEVTDRAQARIDQLQVRYLPHSAGHHHHRPSMGRPSPPHVTQPVARIPGHRCQSTQCTLVPSPHHMALSPTQAPPPLPRMSFKIPRPYPRNCRPGPAASVPGDPARRRPAGARPGPRGYCGRPGRGGGGGGKEGGSCGGGGAGAGAGAAGDSEPASQRGAAAGRRAEA